MSISYGGPRRFMVQGVVETGLSFAYLRSSSLTTRLGYLVSGYNRRPLPCLDSFMLAMDKNEMIRYGLTGK